MPGDEEPSERADDHGGAYDQKDAHSSGRRIGEDTEGDAGIAAVYEVDEIVNELAVPAFARLRLEQGFAGTIEENDGES